MDCCPAEFALHSPENVARPVGATSSRRLNPGCQLRHGRRPPRDRYSRVAHPDARLQLSAPRSPEGSRSATGRCRGPATACGSPSISPPTGCKIMESRTPSNARSAASIFKSETSSSMTTEVRCCRAFEVAERLYKAEQWRDINSFAVVERIRIVGGKRTVARRHYIQDPRRRLAPGADAPTLQPPHALTSPAIVRVWSDTSARRPDSCSGRSTPCLAHSPSTAGPGSPRW